MTEPTAKRVLPSAWPRAPFARIEDEKRVAGWLGGSACFNFVLDAHYKSRDVARGKAGRPPTTQMRKKFVKRILHDGGWLHSDWSSSLANSLAYGGVSNAELLWLVCREDVLTKELNHLYRAWVFRTACDVVGGGEENRPGLCAEIETAVRFDKNMYTKRKWLAMGFERWLVEREVDSGVGKLLASAMLMVGRGIGGEGKGLRWLGVQTFLDTIMRALLHFGMTEVAIVDLLALTFCIDVGAYFQDPVKTELLKEPNPQKTVRKQSWVHNWSTVPTHGPPEYLDENRDIMIPHGERWVRCCVKCSMAGLSDMGLKEGYRELHKFSHPVPTGPEEGMADSELQKFYCKMHEDADPWKPILYQGRCFEDNGVLTPVMDPPLNWLLYMEEWEQEKYVKLRYERAFAAMKKWKEEQTSKAGKEVDGEHSGQVEGPGPGDDGAQGSDDAGCGTADEPIEFDLDRARDRSRAGPGEGD